VDLKTIFQIVSLILLIVCSIKIRNPRAAGTTARYLFYVVTGVGFVAWLIYSYISGDPKKANAALGKAGRTVEALLVALAIAFGLMLMMFLFSLIGPAIRSLLKRLKR
jgi:hypothetical protein